MDEGTGTRDHLRLASSRPIALVEMPTPSDPTEEPLAMGTPRPALTSIAVTVDGDRLCASATLALNGRIFNGTSEGDASDRTQLVAAATLGALKPIIDFDAAVDSATIVDISGHEIAMTILRVEASMNGTDLLVGSAIVRGDSENATARSVLSALNRRLGA